MKTFHIPASQIGNFRSIEDAQRFREARAIQQEVQAVADFFVSQDETAADLNRGRRGQVLLEATSMGLACGDPSMFAQGTVSFEPGSGRVSQLRAEAWNSWAQLANHPISTDELSLSRTGDSTTYRSLSGAVTVDGQGSYIYNKL
jgi:hypothetical protein